MPGSFAGSRTLRAVRCFARHKIPAGHGGQKVNVRLGHKSVNLEQGGWCLSARHCFSLCRNMTVRNVADKL